MIYYLKYIAVFVLIVSVCQMTHAEPQSQYNYASSQSDNVGMLGAPSMQNPVGGEVPLPARLDQAQNNDTQAQIAQAQAFKRQAEQEAYQDRALKEILARREAQIQSARRQAVEMDARYHEQIGDIPPPPMPVKEIYPQPVLEKEVSNRPMAEKDVSVQILRKIAEEKRLQYEIAEANANLAKIRAEIKAETSSPAPNDTLLEQDKYKTYSHHRRFSAPLNSNSGIQVPTHVILDEHGNLAPKESVKKNDGEEKPLNSGKETQNLY